MKPANAKYNSKKLGDDPASLSLSDELSKRSLWFKSLIGFLLALILVFAVVAFGFSIYNYIGVGNFMTQGIYTQTQFFSPDHLNNVIQGTVPLTLSLPNDLSPYVGRTYHVDCLSASHQLQILIGSLPTTWNGAQKTITCTSAGDGFSFVVTTRSSVRVFEKTVGMVFS